ncbi:MAG: hypothetical protein J07HX64_01750 [halophilic archaeon J07HX64]|jgi:hypothetical protein|nr:MAG: hypothetical protein J07HX64_01750 [halophilic archaeon J07HX64]
MTENDLSGHPLADRRVRGLLGLSSGSTIVIVAVLFFEDPVVQAAMLGFAVLDLIVTTYILGLLFERAETEAAGWSGD